MEMQVCRVKAVPFLLSGSLLNGAIGGGRGLLKLLCSVTPTCIVPQTTFGFAKLMSLKAYYEFYHHCLEPLKMHHFMFPNEEMHGFSCCRKCMVDGCPIV